MISAHIERLAQHHDIAGFTCADDGLDRWLHKSSIPMGGEGSNRTHLWVEDETDIILGYFALAPITVVVDTLRSKSAPALLLAKFALSAHLRGAVPKLGPSLLVEALTVAVAGVEIVGGQFLVVDAQHERTHDFYRNFGFLAIDDDPVRLIQKFSAIRKSLL